MLSPSELKQLHALQEKQKQTVTPATDEELEAMERRCAEVYETSAIRDLTEFWDRWVMRFRGLSSDNARLIAEIRQMRVDQPPEEG